MEHPTTPCVKVCAWKRGGGWWPGPSCMEAWKCNNGWWHLCLDKPCFLDGACLAGGACLADRACLADGACLLDGACLSVEYERLWFSQLLLSSMLKLARGDESVHILGLTRATPPTVTAKARCELCQERHMHTEQNPDHFSCRA
jgi:hypothetical protein